MISASARSDSKANCRARAGGSTVCASENRHTTLRECFRPHRRVLVLVPGGALVVPLRGGGGRLRALGLKYRVLNARFLPRPLRRTSLAVMNGFKRIAEGNGEIS